MTAYWIWKMMSLLWGRNWWGRNWQGVFGLGAIVLIIGTFGCQTLSQPDSFADPGTADPSNPTPDPQQVKIPPEQITSIAQVLQEGSPTDRGADSPGPDTTDPLWFQGQVQQLAPLLTGQVYQLEDATGKIWVLSSQTTVKVGDLVTIAAFPRYQSIAIEGQELGEVYLEEHREEYQP